MTNDKEVSLCVKGSNYPANANRKWKLPDPLENVYLKIPNSLVARLDHARGEFSRPKWITNLILAELERVGK